MSESSPNTDEYAGDAAELRAALTEAESRAEQNWNELLRARAEAENIRKRAAKEVEDARKYALRDFLRDLLPVKDSLEKGLAAGSEGGLDASSLLRGTEVTLRQLDELLSRKGVTTIEPEIGESFDPDIHEAVEMRAVPGEESNRIVDVFQKGYQLHRRLIRPALVAVSAPA